MIKWIIAIVVVAVIAGGVWWYFAQAPAANEGAAVQTTSAGPDTSDQALTQDAAAVDAQLQVLDAQQ